MYHEVLSTIEIVIDVNYYTLLPSEIEVLLIYLKKNMVPVIKYDHILNRNMEISYILYQHIYYYVIVSFRLSVMTYKYKGENPVHNAWRAPPGPARQT